MTAATLESNSATGLHERANSGLHEGLLRHLPTGLSLDAPVLDVGCGTGAWLARLRATGFTNLTGVDYDVGQSRFRGAQLARVDLNQADWAPIVGPFALITAIEVVEHLENLGIFFDRLAALLAEDGSILLTTPNVESLAARLRFLTVCELKQFDSIGDRTHLFPVLSATLPRLLERRGLRIVARWGYPDDGRTLTSRPAVNLLCSMLRPLLPEPVPGDNLCILIRRL